MNETLRTLFVNRVIESIEVIAPGPRFERFGGVFLEHYLAVPLGHRGLNALGNPVRSTVDTVSDRGDVAAEYTIEKTYFDGRMTKAWEDLRHARPADHEARLARLGQSAGHHQFQGAEEEVNLWPLRGDYRPWSMEVPSRKKVTSDFAEDHD